MPRGVKKDRRIPETVREPRCHREFKEEFTNEDLYEALEELERHPQLVKELDRTRKVLAYLELLSRRMRDGDRAPSLMKALDIYFAARDRNELPLIPVLVPEEYLTGDSHEQAVTALRRRAL